MRPAYRSSSTSNSGIHEEGDTNSLVYFRRSCLTEDVPAKCRLELANLDPDIGLAAGVDILLCRTEVIAHSRRLRQCRVRKAEYRIEPATVTLAAVVEGHTVRADLVRKVEVDRNNLPCERASEDLPLARNRDEHETLGEVGLRGIPDHRVKPARARHVVENELHAILERQSTGVRAAAVLANCHLGILAVLREDEAETGSTDRLGFRTRDHDLAREARREGEEHALFSALLLTVGLHAERVGAESERDARIASRSHLVAVMRPGDIPLGNSDLGRLRDSADRDRRVGPAYHETVDRIHDPDRDRLRGRRRGRRRRDAAALSAAGSGEGRADEQKYGTHGTSKEEVRISKF